jgi:lysophospholipase L1-like esterase
MSLPRVLIIGQSISLGYTPYVVEMLRGEVEVEHNPDNAGQSDNILQHLDEWALQSEWDLIQLTAGLHELSRDRQTNEPRTSEKQYETNLDLIIRRLREKSSARLLWAACTPIIDARHATGPHVGNRYEKDNVIYRTAAARVMLRHKIPVNDLHALVSANDPARLISADGAHFTEEGYQFLARAVAKGIRDTLLS